MVYLYTKESIEATTKVLKVSKKEEVLAIGGSGDVAFALLEKPLERLVVVDIDENQLKLIKERLNALREGRYEEFTNPQRILDESKGYLEGTNKEALEMRSEYFNEGKRLEKISQNLGNMVIVDEPIDITNINYVLSQFQFDKIYLSNIFYKVDSGEEVENMLANVSRFLRENGKMIIYLTNKNVIDYLKTLPAYDQDLSKIAIEYNEEYKEVLEDLNLSYIKEPLVFGKF